jgi:formylglycine-generating enzyme required for sulfatase activity
MPLFTLLACPAADSDDAWQGPVAALQGDIDALGTRLDAINVSIAGLESRLSDVDAALEAVQAEVEDLASRLTGSGGACPEEMVAVADFCIDRWKASVSDAETCDGAFYGANADDYPTTFPDSGDWTAPLYACSLEGLVPAGELTWFQAAQACALSGKSLCTNAQWQTAVSGTPSDTTSCAVTDSSPVATGSYAACVSSWGTHDQVGIRWEWMADWVPGGATWMDAGDEDDGRQTPWPTDYGDGLDYTLNVNGNALGSGDFEDGLPAAIIRGGDYNNGSEAGNFSMSVARGPSHSATFIGFRCCARP